MTHLARLPTADGRRSTFVVDDPNLVFKLYAPRGSDPQKPHTRDEIYVIAQGTGEFVAQWGAGASPARTGDGAGAPLERITFAPGDVLFAAAGVPHHFENFSDDFATWVIFYGPEGGEAEAGPEA